MKALHITAAGAVAIGLFALALAQGLAASDDKRIDTFHNYGGNPVVSPQPVEQLANPVSNILGVTFYPMESLFNADCAAPLTLEDFEQGNVGAGGSVPCDGPIDSTTNNTCFVPGSIQVGISLDSNPSRGSGGGGVFLLGPGFFGATNKSIGTNFFSDSWDMTFTPPVQAAAMQVESLLSAGPVDVTVYGATGAFVDTTTINVATSSTFIGVISNGSDTIGRINLFSPSNQLELTSEVKYGSCVVGGDTCATAAVIPWPIILTAGGYSDTGDTGVNNDQGVTCGGDAADVFYTFTTPALLPPGLTLDFTTCLPNSPSNTVIMVYDDPSCTIPGSVAACNDDDCPIPPAGGSIFNSTVANFPVNPSTTYVIQIDAASPYSFSASASCPLAPGLPRGPCSPTSASSVNSQ